MGLFSGLNDCIAEDNAQHISMWSVYLKVLASSFVITIGRPGHSHWWKTQMSGWPGGLGRGLGELASTCASWRSRFLGNRPWDGCLVAGGFPGSASEIQGEGWKQYQIVATEVLRSLIWSSGAETVLQGRHSLTRLVRPLYVLCTDQSRVTAPGRDVILGKVALFTCTIGSQHCRHVGAGVSIQVMCIRWESRPKWSELSIFQV